MLLERLIQILALVLSLVAFTCSLSGCDAPHRRATTYTVTSHDGLVWERMHYVDRYHGAALFRDDGGNRLIISGNFYAVQD